MEQPPLVIQAQLQPMQLLTIPLPAQLLHLAETVLDMAVDLKGLRQSVETIGGHLVDTINQGLEEIRSQNAQLQSHLEGVIALERQHFDQILALLQAPNVAAEAKIAQILEEVQAARTNLSAKVAGIVDEPPATPPAEPTAPTPAAAPRQASQAKSAVPKSAARTPGASKKAPASRKA